MLCITCLTLICADLFEMPVMPVFCKMTDSVVAEIVHLMNVVIIILLIIIIIVII